MSLFDLWPFAPLGSLCSYRANVDRMGRWIGAQAVALEVGGGGGGGGLCLEETKAREVKIKLL